ncbi:hypothetical protein L195_g040474 [Trifolium pratense]|uniref:Uncharacterized protein n=1 Tax=Trifolium pratense TaxID=57577 RepID=A0A2K3M0W1_TRIPR|nr:hypothetical protein L195_g040474 [Trifolium pratense]
MSTNSSTSCLSSPAASSIQHIRRVLKMGTMELMENSDDFAEFVSELKDYAWRLNKEERCFLDCVLRLHRELAADASFIITVGVLCWPHFAKTNDQTRCGTSCFQHPVQARCCIECFNIGYHIQWVGPVTL